jgi:hypothetical protein
MKQDNEIKAICKQPCNTKSQTGSYVSANILSMLKRKCLAAFLLSLSRIGGNPDFYFFIFLFLKKGTNSGQR